MRVRQLIALVVVGAGTACGLLGWGVGTARADPPSCAGAIDVSPTAAVNPVGTTHVLLATIAASTCPDTTAHIVWQVRGSVTVDAFCDVTFNVGSQCTFGYDGPSQPGADVITAFIDQNYNGQLDPGEPFASATKVWVLPVAGGPGHVTGGGQAVGVDDVTFAVHGESTDRRTSGGCTVVDHVTGAKVTCLDVTALLVTGTHATLTGHATVNGVATTYRIDVDDGGEPNQDRDAFHIETASGYAAGGPVVRGDVQVRSG